MKLHELPEGVEVGADLKPKWKKIPIWPRYVRAIIWWIPLWVGILAYQYPTNFGESPLFSFFGGIGAFLLLVLGLVLSLSLRLITSKAVPLIEFFWNELPTSNEQVRTAIAFILISLLIVWFLDRILVKFLRAKGG